MQDDKNSRLPGEGIFTIILVAVSAVLLFKAWQISGFESYSAAGTFPMAAAAVMVISAALIARQTLRLPKSSSLRTLGSILPWQVTFMVVMIVIYAVTVKSVGFLPTSFVFFLISFQVLRGKSFISNIGLSVFWLLLVYAVFRLIFGVLMPEGIVPERMILAWIRGVFSGGAN